MFPLSVAVPFSLMEAVTATFERFGDAFPLEVARANGDRVLTTPQISRVPSPRVFRSVVTSTRTPFSPWSIAIALKVAVSMLVGTSRQTLIGGVYSAVVVMSYAAHVGQ